MAKASDFSLGGGDFTATAAADIQEGDYLRVTSAGEVEPSTGRFTQNTEIGTTTETGVKAMYHPVQDRVLVMKATDGGNIQLSVVNPNDDTEGSDKQLTGTSENSFNDTPNYYLLYDPDTETIVAVWVEGGTSRIQAAVITIDTNNKEPLIGTIAEDGSSGNNPIGPAYDSDIQRIVVFQINNEMEVTTWSNDGSALTLENHWVDSNADFSTGYYSADAVALGSGVFTAIGEDAYNSYVMALCDVDASGSVTFQSETTETSRSALAAVYDGTIDRVLTIARNNSTAPARLDIWSIDTGAYTATKEGSQSCSDASNADSAQIGYDPNADNWISSYTDRGNSKAESQSLHVNADGSGKVFSGVVLDGDGDALQQNDFGIMPWVPTNNRLFSRWGKDGSTVAYGWIAPEFDNRAPLIGFAKTAASKGKTVRGVALGGTVNDTHSGLTPGTDYHLAQDITLITAASAGNNDPYYGRALTSDKVITVGAKR